MQTVPVTTARVSAVRLSMQATTGARTATPRTGGTLNNSVEKVSNTEWIVTVTEPKDTGYYSFRISGIDRSPQENPGSEGVAPG